ncbi:MAG TPA: protein kinase [Chthoniobacteraceae bacterium]|nr:protein kinase [Chthoniobacteraceae bacterium]
MNHENPVCPNCGKPLASDALMGLCPDCLINAGFGTLTHDAGAAARAFTPPSPGELAASFPELEILEMLGRGGMGAVYKARQKKLDRIVALKILPPGIGGAGDDPFFAERFAREARALAKLSHPNIVTLYEFGETAAQTGAGGGLFYFLMEFVDGVNLRKVLGSGPVAPGEALAIVPQICDALQFAHDRGIVHRDIKPENILLNKDGQVKIADFGVAKIMSGETPGAADGGGAVSAPGPAHTEAGKVLGTPQYMAPEQISHPADVDNRADIYALGVVFYQMLTGELPKGRFAPPSKKVQIDVRLDEVVLRALEKEPDRRYQQASVFKTHVETIAQTPPPVQQAITLAAETEYNPWQPVLALLGMVITFVLFIVGFLLPHPVNLIPLLVAPIGFIIAALKMAGLWPWCSPMFPNSKWTGRNLRRNSNEPFAPVKNPSQQSAMEFWMAMDHGNYAQAWEAAAPMFQRANSKEEWVARMEKVLRPLGKALTRKTRSLQVTPDRSFMDVVYETSFDSHRTAVESASSALQANGEYKIISYHIELLENEPSGSPSPPLSRSRFSRTAIAGACFIPLFVISLVLIYAALSSPDPHPVITPAASQPGQSPAPSGGYSVMVGGQKFTGPVTVSLSRDSEVAYFAQVFFLPLALLAFISPFLATILGCVAIPQIRHSRGRLYGMWLAVFDGLFFPLLALDALMAWFWFISANLIRELIFLPYTDHGLYTEYETGIVPAISILTAIGADYLIARRVWRAVNAAQASAAAKSPPAQSLPPSPMATLSLGLFLAGLLGTPLLLALAPRAENAITYFAALSLFLAVILGVISRRRLGYGTALGCLTVFIIFGTWTWHRHARIAGGVVYSDATTPEHSLPQYRDAPYPLPSPPDATPAQSLAAPQLGKGPVDVDLELETMQDAVQLILRQRYGLNVSLEEPDVDEADGSINLRDALSALKDAAKHHPLSVMEAKRLDLAQKDADAGKPLDAPFDKRWYTWHFQANSAGELLDGITRDTPYAWSKVDAGIVICPKSGSVFGFQYAPVMSDELTVGQAVRQMLESHPVAGLSYSPAAKPSPMEGCEEVSEFNTPMPVIPEWAKIPSASLILTEITARAVPAFSWEVTGWKGHRELSLVLQGWPWGPAVNGVQVRLRGVYAKCREGITPRFFADIRNTGTGAASIAQAAVAWQLQFDGQTYHWAGDAEYKGSTLPPGREYDDIPVAPDKNWQTGTPGHGLALTVGKHTLAVIVRDPPVSDSGEQMIITSNPVTFEVTPAGK